MIDAARLNLLTQLERKALWLACWTIHNANHIRQSRDGIKVGGHQSSSASINTALTALYLDVLRPEDRIAVKPHASPVYHALMYLLGRQSQDKLERFRALGGAQSYPSRTKDGGDVDFSTGSVGLGVGVTLFGALMRDYVRVHGLGDAERTNGRMIAVLGDAELDEGNIFEALLEGWKHDVRNLWWVIDYNRQSLDGVVNDHLFQRIQQFFDNVGWNVVTVKYGKLMQKAFEGPAGDALRQWIDDCPNQLYSALTFKGGAAFREHLTRDLAGTAGLNEFLEGHDDAALHRVMTNLGGHDMETLLEAFHGVSDDRPHCFVLYTIKGHGLPLAGHKDNHAGLMTVPQMAEFRQLHQVPEGAEWDRFAGLDAEPAALQAFLDEVPFAARPRETDKAPVVDVPAIAVPAGDRMSTQEAFGKIMNEIGRAQGDFADRVITTSPDVTVSTNLGGWVNQRGVFASVTKPDLFRAEQVASPLKWGKGATGQHLELGIAENNLFLALAAMGLSQSLFGGRLFPVGTLYDPFIARGLDALNYACYQDARFLLVATPSGIALAPEGGAHQSLNTPLIGMAQDGLATFEPAFADELATIMQWAFEYMQRGGPARDEMADEAASAWLRDTRGGSVYLRLSTRGLDQIRRDLDPAWRDDVIAGGYWLRPPAPGSELAIVYAGVVAPEAMAAHEEILAEIPGAGLLAVTSADRLNAGWNAAERARQQGRPHARAHLEKLLSPLARDATLVTVCDAHPTSLSWIGSVLGHRVRPLGVEHFGQSADLPDLYHKYRIDTEAILDACAAGVLGRLRAVG